MLHVPGTETIRSVGERKKFLSPPQDLQTYPNPAQYHRAGAKFGHNVLNTEFQAVKSSFTEVTTALHDAMRPLGTVTFIKLSTKKLFHKVYLISLKKRTYVKLRRMLGPVNIKHKLQGHFTSRLVRKLQIYISMEKVGFCII
jgi:hypothetical protein